MSLLRAFALVGCCFVNTSHAETIQRLFTTPEQRYSLEQERLKPAPTKEEVESFELPEPPKYIVFNGLLKQNDGNMMVWINGSNQLNFHNQSYYIELDEAQETISVVLRQQNNLRIALQPGEVLETESERIFQAYEQQEWRARDDSNVRPLAPEANALSN